jgi:hypothetical protein
MCCFVTQFAQCELWRDPAPRPGFVNEQEDFLNDSAHNAADKLQIITMAELLF